MAGRASKPTRHRALEPLADCSQEDYTEAVLLANGITIETMVELVRAGLATATATDEGRRLAHAI